MAHCRGWVHAFACAAISCVVTIASAQVAPDALPILAELDSRIGIAVLRTPEGEHIALRPGDAGPGGLYKVTRIFADRVELEIGARGKGNPTRIWLWKSDPGESQPRFAPVSTTPDSSHGVPMTATVQIQSQDARGR